MPGITPVISMHSNISKILEPRDGCYYCSLERGELGLPFMAQWKQIRLVSMRMQIWSLASLSGLRIRHYVSWSVGGRRGSDLALLWLWYRSAATALFWPLAWELPYAMGMTLKSKKTKQNKTKQTNKQKNRGTEAQGAQSKLIWSSKWLATDLLSFWPRTNINHWQEGKEGSEGVSFFISGVPGLTTTWEPTAGASLDSQLCLVSKTHSDTL